MIAVVTGASKGIGKAIATKFASEGFDLAVCSRTQEDLDLFVSELEYDVKVLAMTCDVSDKNDVAKFSAAIKENYKQIDVVVNNAGYYVPGYVHDEEDGILEKMIGINLYGAYYLTRELLPHMMPFKAGHIFNICSVASIKAYTNGGSYRISKHAIYGFSRVLREEMKKHSIRVTSVLPGATGTDSWAGSGENDERFMTPSDIAEMLWTAYAIKSRSVVEELVMRPMLGDIDENLD
jgi:short-subunit dehydrogenase